MGPVPRPLKDEDSEYDDDDVEYQLETYETIYALLSARSAGFRDKFSQHLSQRLIELQAELAANDE